ncbi:PREDICTED: probable polygalacturonase At3g15720 [Brassica oleracea var. oleracea]|uniref:Polygalacturonase n=1 Tax=Brassica oleracea var. oleracea TaxID=109376 RepID=A0A0D3DT53_BRAOL|nr:PREDICTED: probable polygalacturonase At3g15720 [Brassica oleracea var. oleracea]
MKSSYHPHIMEIIVRVVFVLTLVNFGILNGQVYDVLKFGAKGDGTTDDSEAFVEAWKAMCSSGGSNKTLLVPSDNTFLLQPLVFQGPCNSLSVQVQLEGKIVAPLNKAAWSDFKSYEWVCFNKIIGLTVRGSGTITGHGSSFWEANLPASKRPTQLHFEGCNNLEINGITSFDSPRNHISIHDCRQVKITQIKLIAPGDSPNTDGIDISASTDVEIYDTIVGTGVDCVALNSGSININIARMRCGPGHGISVGSLGKDGEESTVENIQVTNCTFNETNNGARIKTWPNGKGYARNIVFKDIMLTETKNPIIINQQYIDKGRIDLEESSAVAISNVTFMDFHGTSRQDEIIKIDCSEVTCCKDIVLDRIDITTVDGNKPIAECSNAYGNSTNAYDSCLKTE